MSSDNIIEGGSGADAEFAHPITTRSPVREPVKNLGSGRFKPSPWFVAVLVAALLLVCPGAIAQEEVHTLSGTVRDVSTGEPLPGATVRVEGAGAPVAADPSGRYSLSLNAGDHTLEVSFVGYHRYRERVEVRGRTALDVQLTPRASRIERVEVLSQTPGGLSDPLTGVLSLQASTIKGVPALMGEIDPLRTLQLMPGVQAASEGSTGFSVRGGGYDQNLIVLDEVPLYNPSHLMGFFSIFNNDAISELRLYKGDIPAHRGGRISSLVEIRSREGNPARVEGRGGIGTISSRLTLDGPIDSRTTFLLGGRRTYADMFLKLSGNRDMRSSRMNFHDLNGKITRRIGERDILTLSGYNGRDVAATELFGVRFSNSALALRWVHIPAGRLYWSAALTGSFFDYGLSIDADETMAADWRSHMSDYGARADFTWKAGGGATVQWGYEATWHDFMPGDRGGVGRSSVIARRRAPSMYALEHAPWLSVEKSFGPLTLRVGARTSIFHNVSGGDTVRYMRDYVLTEMRIFPRGTFYRTRARFEPRLGATLRVDGDNSLKAGYSRSAQYVQTASNSASGSPLDVWFQSSPSVPPQMCSQWSAGWLRRMAGGALELSAEAFYRDITSAVDFRDHAQLLGSTDLERELRFGVGRAWGVETMLRKGSGRLTGWVSYSFCRARRRIDTVNDGRWYRSPFDKPVNITAVASWEHSPRWNFSASWIYASGTPVTYPVGRFMVENTYVPIYSPRNAHRYPDYHRLDLSATWKVSKPSRRVNSELNFSLYNAYGRKNPWTIIFRQEEERPEVSYAEMIYLFSFVPSVTWNFTF